MSGFDPVGPLIHRTRIWSSVRAQFEVILGDIKQPIQLFPYIGVAASDIYFLHMGDRMHWPIENQLHHVLDDTFKEDRSPARKFGNNLSLIPKYTYIISYA